MFSIGSDPSIYEISQTSLKLSHFLTMIFYKEINDDELTVKVTLHTQSIKILNRNIK